MLKKIIILSKYIIYIIRDYNDKNITYSKNENLLEEQTKFNIVYKTEEPKKRKM
jgi:hypothetical protein